MALYKYFSEHEHAHTFIKGQLFHQTLGYFRDYEDSAAKQIIGDEFESTRVFRPKNGITINNQTQNITQTLPWGFESSVRAGEIYVFCCSLIHTQQLKEEFKSVACVKITNPEHFIHLWQKALPPKATSFAKKVQYYDQEAPPETSWQLPELISTMKIKLFSPQTEFRLGFATTEALGFGQTRQNLVDRKVRPKPRPQEHKKWTVDIGSIESICEFL